MTRLQNSGYRTGMRGNRHKGRGEPGTRRSLWPMAVGFALLAQVLFVCVTHRHLAFQFPLVDAASYHQQAAAAAAGGTLAPGPFWQPPLYPFLLSIVYRVMGRNDLVIRLAHAVLTALAAGLTYGVGRKLLGERAALAAAGLLALYGPMLFFASQLLPAALAVVWNLAALGAALGLLRRRTAFRAVSTGVLLGLGALTVPNILLVVPAVLVFAAVAARRQGESRFWRAPMYVGLACALTIAPVSIRNRIVSGRWVLISTNGGINLYLGNHPETAAYLAVRPGIDWDRLASTPVREGTARNAVESQRYFLREVLRYARARPAQFLGGLIRKTRQLLSGIEIPRNVDLYSFGRVSALLRVLVWRRGAFGFPMGLVMPLALVGLVGFLRRGLAPALLAVWVLIYMASIVLFFPASRYVLPVVPGLLIAAVAAARRIGMDWIRPGRPALGRSLSALGLLVLCNLPVALPADTLDFDAERRLYVGVALQTRGRKAEAIKAYEAVLKAAPDNADAWFYRGTLLRELGRATEAIESHRHALRARPDHYRAMNDLAVLLFRRQQTAEAVSLLRASVALDPLNTQTIGNLVVGLVSLGKIDEANAWRARLGQPALADPR